MTTLITYRSSSGVVRRCDTKCYNAEGDTCKCCCGGVNHGKGEAEAERLTKIMADDLFPLDWRKK